MLLEVVPKDVLLAILFVSLSSSRFDILDWTLLQLSYHVEHWGKSVGTKTID